MAIIHSSEHPHYATFYATSYLPLSTLPFPPVTLFSKLEVLAHALSPDQPAAAALWTMIMKLEQHSVIGYCALKGWMQRHRKAVRAVRDNNKCKAYSRRNVGYRILVDGTRFRDLAKAYFEIVEIVEKEAEMKEGCGEEAIEKETANERADLQMPTPDILEWLEKIY